MPILLLLFIIIPIAEIATFIGVGDIIGLLPTIAVIILTAIIGSTLVRQQGLDVLSKFRENIDSGDIPLEPALHGLFLLVAGLLLITPGFLTDVVGFSLLIPKLRLILGGAIWEKIRKSSQVDIHMTDYPGAGSNPYDSAQKDEKNGPIIEGEVILENESTKPNPNSKWSKPDK